MKFRLDHKGIASIKRESSTHVYVQAVAEVVGATVPTMAPHRSGRYEASIDVVHMGYADARVRVYARDFKANWIEYGAGPSPVRGGHPFIARSPLRRAVLACGLRLSERGKGN
jgi:hypothetical protein